MRIPIGNILRAIVKPASLLGRILSKLKGTTVTLPGGTEIELSERPGPGGSVSPFDTPGGIGRRK